MHSRNKHKDGYDMPSLIEVHEDFKKYVAPNKYGTLSIDFFNPLAVKSLNTALLKKYYNIDFWEIPISCLVPAIPSRADYIHHLADLVGVKRSVHCLDIGVGANLIYPIIGCCEYSWTFVGSDIEKKSLDNAQRIIDNNRSLQGRIELREQQSNSIFKDIILPSDRFDLTLCNPPFHDSAQSAQKGTLRKLRNLKGKKVTKVSLNFSGDDNELWCEGGERAFIEKMISESVEYKYNVQWFSVLVSKAENLPYLKKELQRLKPKQLHIIEMSQGNKISRILTWKF